MDPLKFGSDPDKGAHPGFIKPSLWEIEIFFGHYDKFSVESTFSNAGIYESVHFGAVLVDLNTLMVAVGVIMLG